MTPREQLAETLKRARLDAGYRSQAALAKELHLSRPVITRAESASQPVPSDDVLVEWSRVTCIPLEKLKDLAKRAKSSTPEWFMPYLVAEAAASSLRCWGPLVVPGLLQTEAYARALLSVEPYSPERLAGLVNTRMERQQVIGRVYITAVLDSRVLRECMGSPEIMAEQCAHLIALAESSEITLNVVPEGANVGTWGGLDIATGESGDTVCFAAFQDVTSTAPELAGNAVRAFERLLGAAMDRASSLDFMKAQEERWKAEI